MTSLLPHSAADMLQLHGDAIAKAGTDFCRAEYRDDDVEAIVRGETATLDAVDDNVGTYRMLLLHNFGFIGATVTADAAGKLLKVDFRKV